jgi:hypothetical protein
MTHMEHLLLFGSVMVAAWFLFTYFWPRMLLSVFKRAILVKGFGDGPIPVNTLYTEPQTLFADPLHAPASASKLATTGVNRDTLMTAGWLDLSKGPQVLHVPDMAGRYYTTGTQEGDYLITGPGWKGQAQSSITQISSPNNSVLVFGRVLVESDSDLPTAYDLSKQIQLTPLSGWQPGQPVS